MQEYFRKNKGELNMTIEKLFAKQSVKIEKYSRRFKRLSWLTHYFKVKSSLKMKK